MLVTVCPMYLSELSSPSIRGWLVGHHAMFLVFGYMLASWVGFACYFASDSIPSLGWRLPLCLQCLMPLVLLLGSPWLPRSPRWLILKGRTDEALRVLLRLRQSLADPEDAVAEIEYMQITKQVELEASKLSTAGGSVWTAVWKKPSYRKRMMIGFLMQWGSEFAGPLIIVHHRHTRSTISTNR